MDLNNFCYLGDAFDFNSGNIIINDKYFKNDCDHEVLIKHIIEITVKSLEISNNTFNKNTFVVNVDLSEFDVTDIDKNLITKLVTILEKLFPEKLEVCYVKGASGLFKNMFRYCISLFLNERTKSKIKFFKKNGELSKNDYQVNEKTY